MTQTIHDILAFFREEAFHNRDLGDKFERLIAGYLTREPKYVDLFGGKVWRLLNNDLCTTLENFDLLLSA